MKLYRTTIILFLYSISLLFFTSCSHQSTRAVATAPVFGSPTTLNQKYAFTKGVLWKIESEGLTPSYILGTVHAEDKRVINLSEATRQSFERADTFALEMLLDQKNSKGVMRSMYFSDGSTLKSVSSDITYTKAITAMQKRDMPEDLVNMMKPWAIFTVLNMPEQKTGLFLDAMLYRDAIKAEKKIIGLETMQEQIDVFDALPISAQISLLESTLENGSDMQKLLDETLDIYLTHDMAKIIDLNDEYLSLIDKSLADIFTKRLITDRNRKMADRIIPILQTGNGFIAVGALHLPGAQGILQLLNNQGYVISAIE